jgi:hypothetical protein
MDTLAPFTSLTWLQNEMPVCLLAVSTQLSTIGRRQRSNGSCLPFNNTNPSFQTKALSNKKSSSQLYETSNMRFTSSKQPSPVLCVDIELIASSYVSVTPKTYKINKNLYGMS